MWESVVTLNNRVLEPDATIAPPSGGDGGKGKKGKKHAAQDSQERKEFDAEIYAPVVCMILKQLLNCFRQHCRNLNCSNLNSQIRLDSSNILYKAVISEVHVLCLRSNVEVM